jgi:multisubunit Na+/H+ antiporter MnhB subunit
VSSEQHPLAIAAARLYAPLLVLFGCSLMAMWPAGAGSGFLAGIAFGLGGILNALVFGVDAAQRAFPPLALRFVLVLGALGVASGLALGRAAALVAEIGCFAITGAGVVLVMLSLFGRASTLREGAGS